MMLRINKSSRHAEIIQKIGDYFVLRRKERGENTVHMTVVFPEGLKMVMEECGSVMELYMTALGATVIL